VLRDEDEPVLVHDEVRAAVGGEAPAAPGLMSAASSVPAALPSLRQSVARRVEEDQE
jgi:hypothetical protein